MTTEPNDVRRTTIRRLRQELVADVALMNNLLDVYLEQMRSRGPEILRVESLPNHPLINLKALDEGFSRKNYVRKFLRAIHLNWRAKVTAIEESKDLSSIALDKLISNLKVHEVVMEKDSKIYRGKKERVKSIALKAKK
nr:UBN2 domain-containing protein [Tanacetum cinerariifolium]